MKLLVVWGFASVRFSEFGELQSIVSLLAIDLREGFFLKLVKFWIKVSGASAIMFGTIVRYAAKKPKPKMKPIELKTPPEQTQTITRVIFDIVKEHGPLTIADTWDRVKEVGVRGLTSKRHMKIVLRWMRERQKLRQICNHVGPQKQFLYTTWFTKPNIKQTRTGPAGNASQQPKP